MNQLQYRRQFLLARQAVSELDTWAVMTVGNYYLHIHPDLETTVVGDNGKLLVLLGCLFDPQNYQATNNDILQNLLVSSDNFRELIIALKPYPGRYALLYRDGKEFYLIQDALSLREVYYCKSKNVVICGSQPNLIAKFARPEIVISNDIDFLEFYNTHLKDNRWNHNYKWIGDETFYDGIKHLLPNHYLDINKRDVQRYWPNASIERLSLEEAVTKCCAFLQGTLKSMAYRHQLMQAITAGQDSRTLLAASKEIKDRVYYFINDHGLGKNHPDIVVPKDICARLGLAFHIHTVPEEIDEEFRQIFMNNTFFASDRILSTIYNVYFKNHSDKINILGVGEIGRSRYGKHPRHLNSYRLIYKLGYRNGRYIMNQAEKIIAELLPVSSTYNINALTLFYWEHTLGNWGATGNSESDIAIEELNPFCSHLMYETLLCVDDKYSNYYNPIIFTELIRKMWPELLAWPINPPTTLRNKIMKQFAKNGFINILKEIKYQFYYLGYLLKTSLAE